MSSSKIDRESAPPARRNDHQTTVVFELLQGANVLWREFGIGIKKGAVQIHAHGFDVHRREEGAYVLVTVDQRVSIRK